MCKKQFLIPCILLLSVQLCSGQNLLPNGDFEDGFDNWTTIDPVNISNTTFQSGAKSLAVLDTLRSNYSYVYQEMNLDYAQHEINFWVYPVSDEYINAFELIANWQNGTATFITRVALRDSLISFTAVDTSASIPNNVIHNGWNRITVQVDSTTLQQKFYVNNVLESTLTSGSFPTVEHLLVGDLSITAMYGILFYDNISITDTLSSVSVTDVAELPDGLELDQNYPNPFNSSTTIGYRIHQPTPVRLDIVNLFGQTVATLVDGVQPMGRYQVLWDGSDTAGRTVADGIYLYRLRVDEFETTRTLILNR